MLLPYLKAGQIECGLDEAGRGCLAGPVVAGAVVWPPDFKVPTELEALNDSKQLTEDVRFELEPVIKHYARNWAVAEVDALTIDRINILQASIMSMHLCVDQVLKQANELGQPLPELLLVDGNRFKPYPFISHRCEIKGDGRFLAIAAASVLAKTHRDRLMQSLDLQHPGYGWAHNMGYPTPAHKKAIADLGFTPYHRLSFRSEVAPRIKPAGRKKSA